jgi:hydrogenase maturation protease
MKPILILGLGNPVQGDDGVGCRVAQELEQRALPDNVEVLEGGTPGIGLLNLIEGRARVIIVDAAEMHIAPGEFRRLTAEHLVLTGSAQQLSLHRSGVVDALALARQLNIPLPEIIFLGVQPACIEWCDVLSPAVQAAVPRVIAAILDEVTTADR